MTACRLHEPSLGRHQPPSHLNHHKPSRRHSTIFVTHSPRTVMTSFLYTHHTSTPANQLHVSRTPAIQSTIVIDRPLSFAYIASAAIDRAITVTEIIYGLSACIPSLHGVHTISAAFVRFTSFLSWWWLQLAVSSVSPLINIFVVHLTCIYFLCVTFHLCVGISHLSHLFATIFFGFVYFSVCLGQVVCSLSFLYFLLSCILCRILDAFVLLTSIFVLCKCRGVSTYEFYQGIT